MNPSKSRAGSARNENNTDTLLWAVVGLPMAVECSWSILEEIHGIAQEGMRQLSRGGIEVGGVLFGRRTEGAIRVLAWRPIACEHARGPGFLLSNNDSQALMQLLESAARDPQLQVLEPVGWFVSHTKAGVALTEEDVELHRKFFPEPWQVVLVYEAGKQGPAKAGFFMRERDGRLRTESSYREFTVEGVRYATPMTAGYTGDVPAPARPHAKGKPVAEERPESVPNLSVDVPVGGGHRRVAFAAAALLLGALALFAVPKLRYLHPPQDPLQLRMEDARGQLRIQWDRESPTVRHAESATLYVTDGGKLSPIKLDREATQSGSLTYARMSEDVSVRLVVNLPGGDPYQELARYVGPPVPREEAEELRAAVDGADAFIEETQKLRLQLEQESKRTEELARAVRRLEEQIERESRRPN